MGGSKFVVLQLKQIIRTGIFVLVGIIIIIALAVFILPKNKNSETTSALYIPGTYAAQIILHNKPVNVLVTVDDFYIQSIELSEMEETQEVFYPLLKPTLETLAKEIVKKQTTNINTETNSMYTTKILLDAVNNALVRALASSEIQ